jgi:hypothetical protein
MSQPGAVEIAVKREWHIEDQVCKFAGHGMPAFSSWQER